MHELGREGGWGKGPVARRVHENFPSGREGWLGVGRGIGHGPHHEIGRVHAKDVRACREVKWCKKRTVAPVPVSMEEGVTAARGDGVQVKMMVRFRHLVSAMARLSRAAARQHRLLSTQNCSRNAREFF